MNRTKGIPAVLLLLLLMHARAAAQEPAQNAPAPVAAVAQQTAQNAPAPASRGAQEPARTPPAPVPAAAQQTARTPSAPVPAAEFDRPVSLKRLIPNLASDQKKIWLFPLRLFQGKGLLPAGAVLGTTAGLVALDPLDAPYFRNTTTFNGFNRIFTGNATQYTTVAAPVAFYAAGLLRKDAKMQHTGLLAMETIADCYLVTTAMKDVDRRLRPVAIAPHGNFADTWFEDTTHYGRSNGSFPSGHTIAAFSVATVVARRHGKHRWVPYAAYGLAGLVGFSRLTLSAHFVSDVFTGGALGYSISRFVVLRQ
jgi:membrane-associated phospholipid phosphatase